MAGIGLEFDPTSEESANVPLNVNDGTHFRAMKFEAPTPERSVNWSSSADTEGELPANLRYQNRKLTIEWRVYGTSAANLLEELGKLEQKIGRINTPNEQATLKFTTASGTICIFDLLEGSADTVIDNGALATNRAVVTASFTAKPFWRSGTEVEGTLHEETTKPFVIGVDTGLAGDVPPLGRLVVTEKQGVDQWTLIWGTQSRYYDSSANAELFYEAESRTPIGSSEKKAGPTGASGSGENTIFQGSLIPAYQGVVSTQAASAGAHLSNIGTYRVFARIQRPTTNTGILSVALSWAQGDFLRYTTNEAKTWVANELEGVWTLVDLGLVHVTKVTAGTQRWEGRLLAKSTVAGDDIYVDCFGLFPVDEGYGTEKIEPSSGTPTTLSAHDEFDQSEGTLSGKTLPLGGTWSGAGDAVDFKVVPPPIGTNQRLQRIEVSDADLNTGRYAIAGSAEPTTVQVSASVVAGVVTAEKMRLGILARYSSTENWVMAVVTASFVVIGNPILTLSVIKRVAGTVTVLGEAKGASATSLASTAITLFVGANGSWKATAAGGLSTAIEGQDAALASSGALEKGKSGIYDAWTSASANTRNLDNFTVFTSSVSDAAVFASKKAEVRWDRYQREDSGGTLWVPRADYKGSYFRPPPARREGRSNRTIVKLSRYNTDTMQDAAIDDAAFRIFWQARGLLLPES